MKSISNEIRNASESEFRHGRALCHARFISYAPARLLANMANNREATWTDDENLQETLTRYVQQGLNRSEALDFLKRDFPDYPWSIRSLDRRLRHFNIFYNDRSVEVDEVKQAVEKELKGPGNLLGYRAMHKKIRLEHGLNVTRDQVYNVMTELDPQGLERQRKKGNFTTRGSNWVHSFDGHDKLMGYQIQHFH